MGVFAQRDFSKGERIMVERPLLPIPGPMAVPPESKIEFEKLMPEGGTILEKVKLNGMSCSDDGSEGGLFLLLSRVNHHCFGNSDHHYVPKIGVKVLFATKNIQKGQEITFCYKGLKNAKEFKNRRNENMKSFGFECNCEVCTTDVRLRDKILECLERDDQIFALASTGRMRQAIDLGIQQIKLYDEIGMSQKFYQRTYYDLFQAAIAEKHTLDQGREFVRKAAEYLTIICGDGNDDDIEKYLKYASNPSLHRNYLCL